MIGTIASGTNLDDLADFRPGLAAAKRYGVRHPLAEAGLRKADVRALARDMGLTDLAELAASPCLSSRLETGIPVSVQALELIQRAEELVSCTLRPKTVRCRVRHDGVAVELDKDGLAAVKKSAGLIQRLNAEVAERGFPTPVRFEPYRRGSAFVVRP